LSDYVKEVGPDLGLDVGDEERAGERMLRHRIEVTP
jgi:hypothetical protein